MGLAIQESGYLSLSRGLRTWSKVCPTKVNDKDKMVIIRPGKTTTHQAI